MLKSLIFRDFLSCLSNVKTVRYLYWEIMRQVTICETTAHFMQYLAVLAANKNVPTVLTDVAQRYKSTKWAFIGYAVNIQILWIHPAMDNISNPHMQISYYILSC